MGKTTERLREVLTRQVEILQAGGNRHWKSELEKCLYMLEIGKGAAAKRLLGMYGGMGSLNDVVLDNDEHDVEFSRLRSEAYEIAAALRNAK